MEDFQMTILRSLNADLNIKFIFLHDEVYNFGHNCHKQDDPRKAVLIQSPRTEISIPIQQSSIKKNIKFIFLHDDEVYNFGHNRHKRADPHSRLTFQSHKLLHISL